MKLSTDKYVFIQSARVRRNLQYKNAVIYYRVKLFNICRNVFARYSRSISCKKNIR